MREGCAPMAEPTEVMELPRHAPRRPARRRRWNWRWLFLLIPVLLIGGLVGAWAYDASAGEVDRNVQVESVDVGGVTEDELPVRIAEVAEEFAARPVEIVTQDRTYET